MQEQRPNTPLLDAPDTARLVAAHRERIIELEAHGMPTDAAADELWTVLADILEELKRQQGVTGPETQSLG
jgi:hypothetical protein